eukprot:CAMPEP_0172659436 /NCGR_PEP_ID=MMETSP1074-20121228/3429_1 /TAXON_ID=2916 /ORGANISM="Ceratium fusus, Strain PA161109" /LENGTH=345 /DNA_ID=CAMNT_0013474913 /DNA_START=53 /DNA_END=1091 /DNA_ORIENTATION=-
MDEEDDTDLGLAGLSPEFQAMVGGMAGHTAQFAKLLEKRAKKTTAAEKAKDDQKYLESYEELEIHEDMLKDLPRVEAYRRALEFYSSDWMKCGNITAVDVGSGTGLLAVFCAKYGCQKVVAVEASRLADALREVAEANAPAGTIDVHHCRAEELQLPDGVQVDVVVSEWMGYCLFFENMLPSVLSVRDRFLKPGGLMLPSRCRLLMAPLQDDSWRESKLKFWQNVYGVDMSALVPLATATACSKPQHRLVDASGLVGEAVEVVCFDLAKVKEADLRNIEKSIKLQVPEANGLTASLHGLNVSLAVLNTSFQQHLRKLQRTGAKQLFTSNNPWRVEEGSKLKDSLA